MSIVALQSVTIIGLTEDKERVLDELQGIGTLHLRSLNPEDVLRPARESLSAETREAWRFLKSCPYQRIQVGKAERYDPAFMQNRALEIQRRLEELTDERDFLRTRIEDVRVWGDFQFSPLDEMEGLALWFYIVPHYQFSEVEALDLTWEVVQRDNRFVYVVVISEQEPEGMPVERVLVGAKSLGELEARLDAIELEIDDLQLEREGLTRGLTIYERNMHRLEDMAARSKAAQLTLDSKPLFALQAWTPGEKTDELRSYADEKGLAIVIREPSPADEPPTLLHNPEHWKIGESLVGFYMTPGYRLWDPSIVVLLSFTLFFAMIISDAGYGLVMAAGLLLFGSKLKQSASGRRLRILFTLLATATLFWGILVGSYFGVSPFKGSFFDRLKLIDMNNMDAMMAMSIFIGATHVVIANAMDAWRQRQSLSALAPTGWIFVVIGGVLLWQGSGEASRHPELLQSLGSAGVGIGLLAVFLFSGAGSGASLGKRIATGFLSLTRVTNAFGDVLSYLRLFALGLASASLAIAFNDLARDARESIPGIGFFFAILIIVVGHTLNFVLAIVSGFVHGLRLNLIEFFNWSVPEEGRPFRVFRKKETLASPET